MHKVPAVVPGRAADERPPARHLRRRRGRVPVVLATGLCLVLILVGVPLLTLDLRIDRISLTPTSTAPGLTVLLLGSDSRAVTPAGLDPSAFGTEEAVPGTRADTVLLLHRDEGGQESITSIPRDLLVQGATGTPRRLALTLLDGPQATVDTMCRTLGVGVDHVLVADGSGLVDIVDAAGGLDIDIPHPIRDEQSSLLLGDSGRLHLDGAEVLALARSRHPEVFIDGQWAQSSDKEGALERTTWSSIILDEMREQLSDQDPISLARVSWVASEHLTADRSLSIRQLYSLASGKPSRAVLPAAGGADGLFWEPDDTTTAFLAASGLADTCVR